MFDMIGVRNGVHILIISIKRIGFFISLLLISIFLTACDYEVSLYNANVRGGLDVISIHLISYNSQNDILTYEMNIFIDDNLEKIERLDDDKLTQFLEDLSEITAISSKPKNNIKSPSGFGVLLTYEDNGFTIITLTTIDDNSVMYIGDFCSDKSLEYYESFIWNEVAQLFSSLLFDYFEYTA